MICKWCGALLREGDMVCGRCGREIPPLSDCGGFFDLVPGARGGVAPAAPVMAPNPVVEQPPVPQPDRSGVQPRNTFRRPGISNMILMAVSVVLLVLTLVFSIRSCSLSAQLEESEAARIKAERLLKEESEAATEPSGTEVTEETEDGTGTAAEETTGETTEEVTEETEPVDGKPAKSSEEDPTEGESVSGESTEATGQAVKEATKETLVLDLRVDADSRLQLEQTEGWTAAEEEEWYVLTRSDGLTVWLALCYSEEGNPELKVQLPDHDNVDLTWSWDCSQFDGSWKVLTENVTDSGVSPEVPAAGILDILFRCTVRFEVNGEAMEIVVTGIPVQE